jgi:scyllo-inositol 2-dehydrogenase (NADP+)
VKKIIDSGRLGNVFQYEAHYDRFRPWMKGGWREQDLPGSGILYDLGAHLIDQALQLFGAPDSLLADVLRQRDAANADDYFHLVLRYGRRRIILHASMFALEPGPHYAVYGDAGSFVKYGMDPQEDALRAGRRPGDLGWGVDQFDRPGTLTLADGTRETIATEAGAWERFYQALAAALTDGAAVPVNPVDARNVVALIEQAANGGGNVARAGQGGCETAPPHESTRVI